MQMKITNYYINSEKQSEQYQNLCKAVSSSQDFKKNIKGLNMDKKDIDLYLSYLFLENTTQLNLYIRQMLASSSPDINRNASIKILNTMSNQLLNPTKTIYTFAKLHNKNFKNFPTQVIDYANPMVITIQQIEEEFDVNKYERSLREEGREEGETRLATLLNRLFSDNRMEDARLVLTDKNLREKLYREYGIK